jgi:CrcB protein
MPAFFFERDASMNAAVTPWLVVFVGGGLGSMLRHGVNVTAARMFGTGFPFGTLVANITGCFVMGLIAGYLAFRGDASQTWRLFLMTGVLGGYTTFSAFSLDALLLWERGQAGLAALYVVASVVLALLGVVIGMALTRG